MVVDVVVVIDCSCLPCAMIDFLPWTSLSLSLSLSLDVVSFAYAALAAPY